MKAILILDNIDETEIAELRANVQLNLYGEDRGEYNNCPLKPMPKGRWIRDFDGNEFYWYCSNCKESHYEEDLYMGGNEFPNFCPNCGANMRENIDEMLGEESNEID